jgi:hypothetical protein
MYYRLTYTQDNEEKSLILRTNKEDAENQAHALLGILGGTITLEKRVSEYFGEWNFHTSVSQLQETTHKEPEIIQKCSAFTSAPLSHKKLGTFKTQRLEEEPELIQELVYICEAKKVILPNSELLCNYNARQKEIVEFILGLNVSMDTIHQKMKAYEVEREFYR